MSNNQSQTSTMNHIAAEEEELGIYSDDDEDGGDLSDDEPPLTDQDTSGRPQSQFKLRVTSAISTHSHQLQGQATPAVGFFSNHLDSSPEDIDEDLSEESLDELDLSNESSAVRRQQRLQQRQQDNSTTELSNKSNDTKIK